MKDYKKILEGIVNIINAIENSDIGFDTIRAYISENCPEFIENNDNDKIRKGLIEALRAMKSSYHYVSSNIKIDDAIAWLEHQGDYSKLVEEIKKRKELFSKEKENATSDNDKLSLGGRIAMLEELLVFVNEKQGEPVEISPSKFDSQLNKLLKQFETLPKEELMSSLSFYLNVVQNNGTYKSDEKQGEQMSAWSEEDEKRAERLLGWLDTLVNYIHHDVTVSLDLRRERMQQVEQLKTWLKFLRERVQPQDDRWKPTEEQYEALDYAYNSCSDTERGNYYEGVLGTLIEDLHRLEKQGQKVDNNVEPKFRVGNWIVNNDSGRIYQIKSIKNYEYCLWPLDSDIEGFLRIANVDNDFHLWDITKDAKKGDVLVHNGCTFIFMGIENGIVQAFEENLLYGNKTCNFGEPDKDNDYSPASKERQDLLFQKMKEAGYEFDFDKEELKKIEDEEEGR